jgi:hypothetical protein
MLKALAEHHRECTEVTPPMITRRTSVHVKKSGIDKKCDITVPVDAEIRRLAYSLHAKRQPHEEKVAGCYVSYKPAQAQWAEWLELEGSLTTDERDAKMREMGVFDTVWPTKFEITWNLYTLAEWYDLYSPVNEPSGEDMFMYSVQDDWFVSLTWLRDDDKPQWNRSKEITTASDDSAPAAAAMFATELSLREGTLRITEQRWYDRNPEARDRCIVHYGTRCLACGIDFGETYGPVAHGFIEVHHLTLISSDGQEHTVDPINDLRPLCPNCHAVAHRRWPMPYTIEEIKEFIRLRAARRDV